MGNGIVGNMQTEQLTCDLQDLSTSSVSLRKPCCNSTQQA